MAYIFGKPLLWPHSQQCSCDYVAHINRGKKKGLNGFTLIIKLVSGEREKKKSLIEDFIDL